jgi:hypothetical protein
LEFKRRVNGAKGGDKMLYHLWRLSEGGENNLGLAFTSDRLVLGRTLLIERRDNRFTVRERGEIALLLCKAYKADIVVDRLMSGLAVVASALNSNDPCLARIAAVHLRVPDLADQTAKNSLEATDALIKSDAWDPALHPRTGTPPNPGWFAPAGGEGSDSASVRTAQNDDPNRRVDASPAPADNWVRLPSGPKRIDELADFVEWLANATSADEQTIRAEIKRYFYDAGDQGSAAALNSALSVVLRPGISQQDRQQILDSLDVYTRADPKEYAATRDWTTGAAILAGTLPPGAAGEAAAAGAVTDTASQAWKLGWAARGNYFSEVLGANLPSNFPVIDTWLNGVATSIKSIDLNAATYQDAPRLTHRLNNYIDSMATYDGGELGDLIIAPTDIQNRVLSLAIPKGNVTAAQQGALDSASLRGRAFGVELKVTEF